MLFPGTLLAESFLKQFPLRHESKYFEFYYKRNPERIAEIARFAEGFVTLVHRDFLKADYQYPIRILVLEDKAAFEKCLWKDFGMRFPPDNGISSFSGEGARGARGLRARHIRPPHHVPTGGEKHQGLSDMGFQGCSIFL
jgi:hypothetical protein